MNVSLIVNTPDAEKMILYIARVSSNQDNEETGLIRYLIKNKHWSPFEHAHMTLEIITSRAIAQQIIRHRSFAFQEFSQRYAVPDHCEFYNPRKQAVENRQSSTDDLDEEDRVWFQVQQSHIQHRSFEAYEESIKRGIAKESARFLLPLSVQTKLYMTGSVRSWIHYFELRCDEHTQLEHREIAEAARNIFKWTFPIISDALEYE